MKTFVRTLWGDLAPGGASPLAPVGWARMPLLGWSPHVFVVLAAAVFAGSSWHILLTDYDISNSIAATLGIAHALTLVVALRRPLAGWWLSLVMVAVTSMSAASVNPDWGPLVAGPSLSVHLSVLALVGLRVQARVAFEMWVLTVAVSLGLYLTEPGREQFPNLPETALLSGAVLVAAASLRARGEAMRRLAEQRRLRAEDHARHALLEERARIARELHDVVAHHMSVVAIQAEAAPYRVADMPDELARSFGTIRGHALEALTELHRVLGLLRNEAAGEGQAPQPTMDQLSDLVEGVRGTGLDVGLTISGGRRPAPAGLELSVYRIVQESLSNALRHAPGARVEVEVGYHPERLEVSVVNGPAIRPLVAPPGGRQGLVGMRERAAMLGGELTTGPRADGGYRVHVVVPLGGAVT